MKKIGLAVLSLLVIAMFLVGCAEGEVSDTELETQLEQLSDEELDQAIETVEAQDTEALAGQAYWKYQKIPRAPKYKFLKSAYKVKLKRVQLPSPEVVSNFVAKWDPTKQNKLQFTWNHANQVEQYYIILDMWNTYASGPLPPIDNTINELKEYGVNELTMKQHVYEYNVDKGELHWGWYPNMAPPNDHPPGTFKIHAYLYDKDFNLVKEVAYVQLVVDDGEAKTTSTPIN